MHTCIQEGPCRRTACKRAYRQAHVGGPHANMHTGRPHAPIKGGQHPSPICFDEASFTSGGARLWFVGFYTLHSHPISHALSHADTVLHCD